MSGYTHLAVRCVNSISVDTTFREVQGLATCDIMAYVISLSQVNTITEHCTLSTVVAWYKWHEDVDTKCR